MKSEDCVSMLVDQFGGTPKSWKRLSKKKEGVNILRQFQNRETGQVQTVVEEAYGFLSVLDGSASPAPALAVSKMNTLFPKAITVDFKPGSIKERGYSGRVIYDFGCKDEDAGEEGQIVFYCGQETTSGWMDDRGDGPVDDHLMILFADLGNYIEVGAAEAFHLVGPIPGVTAKELWAFIKDRLDRSGAVKMKKH